MNPHGNDDYILKGVLSHLHNLLAWAKNEHIGNVVPYIFQVDLSSLSPVAIEECVRWVIEKALHVQGKQLLFLCATLGHIADIKNLFFLPIPNGEKTKMAFDRLLQNLENCIKKRFRPPANCMHLLRRSAFTVVQGSSDPGWLTFAAHFRPFFDMKYVLEVNMNEWTYSKESFLKLVRLLVMHLESIKKFAPEEQRYFQPLLKRMLQCAPDEDVLFQVFQNKEYVYRFFSSPSEREHFFSEFLKDSLDKMNENLGEKLKHIIKLSKNFHGKISGIIFAYVMQFIDTIDKQTSDDMDAAIYLISYNLSEDRVLYLLQHLSKSPLPSHQDLFIQLLNDGRFTKKWDKVASSEKLKICTIWIGTKAHSSEKNFSRIKGTFEAVDMLISCAHISSNTNLIENLCYDAFFQLRKQDPIRVVEEFGEINAYSPHVQNCFQGLVQEMLQKNSHLLKNKETIQRLCNNTR